MRTVGKESPAALARQVSEDHCWLSLDGSGRRDAAVELTTSNAALRGLAPGAEAWSGWLYAGGRAHTLTQRQVIASLVVSMDPTVVNGRAKRVSGPLAGLQLLLLRQLQAAEAAMYPAAVCALAAVQQAWMNRGLAWGVGGGASRSSGLWAGLALAVAPCLRRRDNIGSRAL